TFINFSFLVTFDSAFTKHKDHLFLKLWNLEFYTIRLVLSIFTVCVAPLQTQLASFLVFKKKAVE
ncbi:hypothetical protein BpHYR1_045719, partial [Brachionus plicatilis]